MFDGAEPTCPGLPWRDLQFRGPFLEMFFHSMSSRDLPRLQLTSAGMARWLPSQ
jgi:hypothetical protein